MSKVPYRFAFTILPQVIDKSAFFSLRWILFYFFFAEETIYYVSSNKGKDFRLSTQPAEHSLYSEEFRFTLEHPRGNQKEAPYFVYPGASSRQTFVTSKLDLSIYTNFPLDVVVLSTEGTPRNFRKIYLIDRSDYGPMISLDDYDIVNCCEGKLNFSFYAHNVTESGKISRKVCFLQLCSMSAVPCHNIRWDELEIPSMFCLKKLTVKLDEIILKKLFCLQVTVQSLDASPVGTKPANRVICSISNQLVHGTTHEMHVTD